MAEKRGLPGEGGRSAISLVWRLLPSLGTLVSLHAGREVVSERGKSSAARDQHPQHLVHHVELLVIHSLFSLVNLRA